MWSFALTLGLCLSSALAGYNAPTQGGGSGSSSYSGSSSSSSSSSSSGGSGGAGLNSGFSSGGYGGGSFGNPGFFQFPTAPVVPYPNPMFNFNQMFQQFLASAQAAHSYANQNPAYAAIFQQQMAMLAAQQQLALAQYPFAFPGIDSNFISTDKFGSGSGSGSSYSGSSSSSSSGTPGGYGGTYTTGQDGNVYTSGSVNYGSQGGYGQASAVPGGPDGLGVRISEEFPAPSGGSFGTFSSSSSGVSTVNGKTTSYKTSTVGVNDNGKIHFKTVTE